MCSAYWMATRLNRWRVFPKDDLAGLRELGKGTDVMAAAYESHEEEGEVSLMITKHCVRFSLSLCPKQAKGVKGVQGQVKAEPLALINGKEKLTLRFDCKPARCTWWARSSAPC